MQWSKKDIEMMKFSFLNGEKIKLIAHKMGRTPTSINKALSRFGIRRKTGKAYNYRFPLALMRSYQNPIYANTSIQKTNKVTYDEPTEVEDNWVNFQEVVIWLQTTGDRVNSISYLKNTYFVVNGKILTKEQVLIYANKRRIEKKLPIFLVKQMTW